MVVVGGLAIVWVFTVALSREGWLGFLFKTSLLGSLGVAAYAMVGITQRKLEKEIERVSRIRFTCFHVLIEL